MRDVRGFSPNTSKGSCQKEKDCRKRTAWRKTCGWSGKEIREAGGRGSKQDTLYACMNLSKNEVIGMEGGEEDS